MDRAIDVAAARAVTGWLVFALLAGVVLVGTLWLGRLDRGAAMLVGSALFVAAAGYAWQGSPGFPGAPRHVERRGLGADTLFASERQGLLDHFGETGQWLAFADGLNRMGEDQAAVSALRGAIARRPRDAGLRVGYAHALLVLADYNFTPAVALAFRRAATVDPNDPAPSYFEALARFEARDFAGAEAGWRALDTRLPAASPWHRVIRDKLRLFDLLRAQAR